VHLQVHGGATSGSQKSQILDFGIDPAGGTSYTAFFSNLVMGEAPAVTAAAGVREWLFPIFIAAGSSVAVRIQGANASAGTVFVMCRFFGYPSRPEVVPVGQFSETIGTITNSSGVSFTPGNAADGAWASLGTTTNNLWWWQLGYQIDNGTITAEYTFIELAYGDASNKQTILKMMHAGTTGETCGLLGQTQMLMCSAYCPVLGGTNIYVRGRTNNAPDTGYNAVAIGIGG
jgi:hypothetical protein